MNWVFVHRSTDGVGIWINLNHCITMQRNESNDSTHIITMDDDHYSVDETLNYILYESTHRRG